MDEKKSRSKEGGENELGIMIPIKIETMLPCESPKRFLLKDVIISNVASVDCHQTVCKKL